MLGVPKFGRTIKVTLAQPGLGVFTITDWQGGKAGPSSFDCDIVINRHTRPEPQQASITVRGLSRETRSKILALHKAAESQAFKTRRVLKSGQVSIYAGYRDDAGLLFVGELPATRNPRSSSAHSTGGSRGRDASSKSRSGPASISARFRACSRRPATTCPGRQLVRLSRRSSPS